MRATRFAMLLGSACSLAVAGSASAQDQAAAAETPAAESGLKDIVVTAERRSESLQRTPIAISAISTEQVELKQITETKDLSAIAPNVSVLAGTTSAAAVVVTIRGIPTGADESFGFDNAIGLYVDGVYLGRSAAASFDVADIERVEVLRGPQGTLFGRNTTGGAINFIGKKPSKEASGKVRVGYGNYGAFDARAILNSGEIGDALSMSLGYLHRQKNGFVDNILQSRDSRDPGESNTDSIRWAANLEIGSNLTVDNIFDFTKVDATPIAAQLSAVGTGAVLPPLTIGGYTFAQTQPAPVAGYLAAATAVQTQCGTPLSNVSLSRRDPICLDGQQRSTDKVYGNMTRVTLELEPVTLRSTTAFRGWRNTVRGTDLDGLGTIRGPLFSQATTLNGFPQGVLALFQPAGTAAFLAGQAVPTTNAPLFVTSNRRKQNQFTQELELLSNGTGPFTWVLGGFYFQENGSERNPQNYLFVLDTNQTVFNTTNFGALAPTLQAANPARYRGVPVTSILDYQVESRSVAVYGQGTYRFGGEEAPFGVTLGLRYTWDRKAMDRFQNGAVAFSAAELALNSRSAKFSAPTGNLTFDYRATPDLNFYARVARGYRSGGFNARQTTNVANNVALIPFDKETIWSYELGAKTQFFDRVRLNAAVFLNDYSDQLANVPIAAPAGSSFGTQIINAGKTRYTGAELEGTVRITDYLTADGSFGYVHKDVKQFPGADTTGTIRNIADIVTPSYSPDYTANAGLAYKTPIGADARLTARVGWNYTSSQRSFVSVLAAPFETSTRIDARSLFDAQIRVDNLRLGGFGQGVSLMLWGKNLTDKDYTVRGIDYGQLGFAQLLYGEPRTYGATVEFSF